MRRLYDTNFWGVVHGSIEAARHLKERGGAIINIGSTLSDRAIPIQGVYSSSKHAVKGFTDALRMELEADGAPISVTLIKPGAINTPYTRHAKNLMPNEPEVPAPVYAPEVVARAILHCAEVPERDVFAGGGGKAISASGNYAPRLTDKLMEMMAPAMQQKDKRSPRNRRDGLYEGAGEGKERGDYEGHVAESSLYTEASIHPVITGALLLGAGLALAAFIREQSKSE
jgi:short-subunit dehydrogenase